MKRPGSVLPFLLLLPLFLGGEARAACRVTATSVSFGAYDVFSPVPLDSTGSVSVSCDELPPSDVVIEIGPSAGSGGFNPRQMRHPSRPGGGLSAWTAWRNWSSPALPFQWQGQKSRNPSIECCITRVGATSTSRSSPA